MLESTSRRLMAKGEAHHGSPDKDPNLRLAAIRAAGELHVPFTSGILIGIGESRGERLDALFALRDLHREHGHLQEVIVQNFRAKPDTKMARCIELDRRELQWTIAAARLILGAKMNIQAPPNLTPSEYALLIDAGLNDWGGVSPVTPDHVNPELPWPHVEELARRTRGPAYDLDLSEVARRAKEAWQRGATEVCMQAASTRTTRVRRTCRSCARSRTQCRRCTCTRSRRSR